MSTVHAPQNQPPEKPDVPSAIKEPGSSPGA